MNTLRSITRCVLLGLGIAALPAILSAQPVSNFTSVLQRIPQPPAVPTDAELLSKPPEYFETSSDLNSIAQEIDGYVNKLEARATLPAGGAMTGPGESAPTEM